MVSQKYILWVDDDEGVVERHRGQLELNGYRFEMVSTVAAARRQIERSKPDLVIVDFLISSVAGQLDGKGGVELAVWLQARGIPYIGISTNQAQFPAATEFRRKAKGYVQKQELDSTPARLIREVTFALAGKERTFSDLRAFIVHGHDETLKLQTKNFLQNALKMPEPSILHELPSGGRTVIEKFEDCAADIDVVFVLLTPDDSAVPRARPRQGAGRHDMAGQPRPNVVFEMGYFLGKLGRRSGKVLLLRRAGTSLGSDLSGIVYIDVNGDVDEKSEEIRRELQRILHGVLLPP